MKQTFLVFCLMVLGNCSGGTSHPASSEQGTIVSDQVNHPTPRNVKMTGTIQFPVLLLEAGFPVAALAEKREALVVIAGGPDELPEGPAGFDVAQDGRYLISDPIRDRVAIYDSSGAYKGEWTVGFPVDSISEAPDSLYRLHPSDSTSDRFFDILGKEHDAPATGQTAPALTTRLTSPGHGTLEGRKSGGPLNINFEDGLLRLISLQPLDAALGGAVYVALEVTPGGDTVTVQKRVREYGKDGSLLAEADDIPVNYDFPPTDELKVRRGTLYQLAPFKTRIDINRWNLDPR